MKALGFKKNKRPRLRELRELLGTMSRAAIERAGVGGLETLEGGERSPLSHPRIWTPVHQQTRDLQLVNRVDGEGRRKRRRDPDE
jgi:hypothetical protein